MEVLHGARLFISLSVLCVALLLSSLESTVVSTALVTIASDFDNYAQSNWVVISYLLTYSSFLVVFARLSDTTGRKVALLTGVGFFAIASLACGLAQTLTQLIIFRAFQGVGGSGVYAMTMVVVMDITPQKHIGPVSGMVNSVFVVASAIGPVVGGAITSNSTWRWCFYINVPPGVSVFLLMLLLFPRQKKDTRSTDKGSWKLQSILRVDWLGFVLLLAATILVILALEEGGNPISWDSATIVVMFVMGGISWIMLAVWQTYLTYRPGEHLPMPVFPLRVILHRIIGGLVLTSLGTGIAFTSSVVYLPQRFQIVNNLSPIQAGVRTLPLLLASAFANIISSLIMGKKNLGSWLILLGNVLQLVGLGLSSSVVNSTSIPATAYGYQLILGLGIGTSLGAYFLLARIEVSKKDIALAVGAITQLRLFGGVIGVAICRVAQKSYLSFHLSQAISPATLKRIEFSIDAIRSLPPEQAATVRKVYGEAFDFQWHILTYLAAANVALGLLTFRRHAKPIQDADFGEEARKGQENAHKGEDELEKANCHRVKDADAPTATVMQDAADIGSSGG